MKPRKISYNSNAFLIDDQPTPIISGAMHYFRTLPEQWAERIHTAKEGGLNTIETYVAWNFHEYEKGKFDFSGTRDLDKFLSLCETEDMFVILRPGPYICAEWNFGGFPAWLGQEPDVRFRTFNPTYLKFVDRWFDALFELVTPHLVTRGGGIILVQAENEFSHISQEDFAAGQKYLYHLCDKMQALGVDVPIITCDGGVPGCIQCINSHRPAEQVPEFREMQPDAPLFATEFWSAWYDVWGEKHHTRAGRDLAYHTMKFIAAGAAGYNYYMYHGGTNFGYTTMYLQTTSYDFDAPISETGYPTQKYLDLLFPANFLRTFTRILLNTTPQPAPEVQVDPRLQVTRREFEGAEIIFIDNAGDESVRTSLKIGDTNAGEFTLEGQSILPVLRNYPVTPETRICWSTVPIQNLQRRSDGSVSIFLKHQNPKGKIELQHNQERQIFPIEFSDRQMSLVTKFHDVEIWGVGAKSVDEDETESGENSTQKPTGPPDKTGSIHLPNLPTPPKLTSWRGCRESALESQRDDWLTLPEPVSMLTLGNYDGYGWYRTRFNSPRGGLARLQFSDIADRILVWLNDVRVGTSATPPEDRQGKFPAEFEVQLKKGKNRLLVLADNLGLAKGDWQIGRPQHLEAKGLLGPVHVSNLPGMLQNWEFLPKLALEREVWDEATFSCWSRLADFSGNNPAYFTTEFEILKLESLPPLRVDLTSLKKGLAWLNGRLLGRYWNIGPESRLYLPAPWLQSRNRLVIFDEAGTAPVSAKLIWDDKYLHFHNNLAFE